MTAAHAHGTVQDRMPGLDGLRGMAILLVLVHGFDVLVDTTGLLRDLDLALNVGWIGVQLFFVLSGFLITGILLDTQQSPAYYRNFYVRRVLRIFPLYYGVLFVAFVVVPLVARVPAGYGDRQLALWTYTENFVAPFAGSDPVFPHFWSLCVEEQFYLVWPLVVRSAGRRGIIALGWALVIVAIATRIYARAHFDTPIGADVAYSFTPCRMDALAIGAMTAAFVRGEHVAAWLLRGGTAARITLAGALLVLAGVVAGRLARSGATMQIGGYTVIASGFALVLLGAATTPMRFFTWSPLRRIGTYSYGMYVFYAPLHLVVGLPLLARLGAPPSALVAIAYIVAASLVTFGVAALSYHLYERHFLALKMRFAPRTVR